MAGGVFWFTSTVPAFNVSEFDGSWFSTLNIPDACVLGIVPWPVAFTVCVFAVVVVVIIRAPPAWFMDTSGVPVTTAIE
jgi:hypothetical protein